MYILVVPYWALYQLSGSRIHWNCTIQFSLVILDFCKKTICTASKERREEKGEEDEEEEEEEGRGGGEQNNKRRREMGTLNGFRTDSHHHLKSWKPENLFFLPNFTPANSTHKQNINDLQVFLQGLFREVIFSKIAPYCTLINLLHYRTTIH